MTTTETSAGTITALWRYPVKSMRSAQLDAAAVTARGLHGDRAYALIDPAEGRVVSAKNPRKWPNLLHLEAAFVANPSGDEIPPVEIRFPDGRKVTSEQKDCNAVLSEYLGREVTLSRTVPANPVLQQFWPENEAVTDEAIPRNAFFDAAFLHLVTTSTLRQLQELHPQGDWSLRRFRPNCVIATPEDQKGFVENQWVGSELLLGQSVRVKIVSPCPRCVMTTLPQPDLAADPGILQTAAKHNQAHIGVYAEVVQGGEVRQGESIRLIQK